MTNNMVQGECTVNGVEVRTCFAVEIQPLRQVLNQGPDDMKHYRTKESVYNVQLKYCFGLGSCKQRRKPIYTSAM